jgi:hypothetical protein
MTATRSFAHFSGSPLPESWRAVRLRDRPPHRPQVACRPAGGFSTPASLVNNATRRSRGMNRSTREAHASNAPGLWKSAPQLAAALAIMVGLAATTPASADTGFGHDGASLAHPTGTLVSGPNSPDRKKSTSDADVKLTAASMFESILKDVPGWEASGLANFLVEAAARSQSVKPTDHRPTSISAARSSTG